MKVSTSGRLPSADRAPETGIPDVRKDVHRRLRVALGDGARLLGPRMRPDPDDADLFRALLSGTENKDRAAIPERKATDGDGRPEPASNDPRDDVAAVRNGQPGPDHRKGDTAGAIAAAVPDLAALSGVVTKVYLDSLHDGQREVGIALDDDLLPATHLAIREREGRLAVDFVSVNPCARERLRRGAEPLAERVASDLSRDVAVKVAAHDGDPLALEVRADASGGRVPWRFP